MGDKSYAWLEVINQRDHALLILSVTGVARGVSWVLLDTLKLSDNTTRMYKYSYAGSCLSLYILTILIGITHA
jgi:hypothetical protein